MRKVAKDLLKGRILKLIRGVLKMQVIMTKQEAAEIVVALGPTLGKEITSDETNIYIPITMEDIKMVINQILAGLVPQV